MSYLDAVILGVLQGLTEFLPVSSSGHLVLAEHLLGAKQVGVSFELIVHLGTLLSVFVYFRQRILELIRAPFDRSALADRKIVGYLVLATIPAGLAGYFFDEWFEQAFSEPSYTSVALLITGAILFVSRYFKNAVGELSVNSSLAMGLGQALAIFPGISRSGSTIVAGMMAGATPLKVAEFSFLMAIPVIAGASLLKIKSLLALDPALYGPYLVSAFCSFAVGLVAVYAVLSIIKRGRFEYFAFYCVALGFTGLYLF